MRLIWPSKSLAEVIQVSQGRDRRAPPYVIGGRVSVSLRLRRPPPRDSFKNDQKAAVILAISMPACVRISQTNLTTEQPNNNER